MPLTPLDIGIMIAWLALTAGVGVLAGRRLSGLQFWISGRDASLWPLVFSVVATQVGAGAIVGIASATYAAGIGFGLVSLLSTVLGFVLVARLAPRFNDLGQRLNAVTLPRILGARYGRPTLVAAALVVLATYVIVLAAQFMATSAVLAVTTGLGFWLCVILASGGVIAYAALAGIRGDLATDVLHGSAMALVLFGLITPFALAAHPPAAWWSGLPPRLLDPTTFGGISFVLFGSALGIAIPLLMPEIWMKVYAARSGRTAARAMFLAAVFCIPFYLFSILLGLFGAANYTAIGSPDTLLFVVIGEVLPAGLRGAALAALLSVILSTANTLLLVVSSTVTADLAGLPPDSGTSLRWGRIATAGAGLAGVALSFAAPGIVQLLLSAFYVLLVLAPSLVGALFWRRGTARGALASIVLGVGTTVACLFVIPTQAFLPGILVSVAAYVLVSLMTRHGPTEDADILRGGPTPRPNA